MAHTMKTVNKKALRDKLLSLEAISAEEARQRYDDLLRTAQLNRTEQMDEGDRSQAEHAGAVAADVEKQIHTHLSYREVLQSLPLHPMTAVGRGAVVSVNGRILFLSVPTQPIAFEGLDILGVSCEAPLAKALSGLRAGDWVHLGERLLVVEAVQ